MPADLGGGNRKGYLSTLATPTPEIRDIATHLHNGNEVFVPANFKAMSHVNSSQRMGAATLLPLGTFMFPKPRDSQSLGKELGRDILICPIPARAGSGVEEGAHNPKSWAFGELSFARKWEAWTMSQSLLPSTPYRRIHLPQVTRTEFHSRAENSLGISLGAGMCVPPQDCRFEHRKLQL